MTLPGWASVDDRLDKDVVVVGTLDTPDRAGAVNKKTQELSHFTILRNTHVTDWIEQCFTSPPTQHMLYGRRFLQVKRPNQQYQSTEGTNITQTNQTYNMQT